MQTQNPGPTSRSSVCGCAAALMNLSEALQVVLVCSPGEDLNRKHGRCFDSTVILVS